MALAPGQVTLTTCRLNDLRLDAGRLGAYPPGSQPDPGDFPRATRLRYSWDLGDVTGMGQLQRQGEDDPPPAPVKVKVKKNYKR